MIFENKNFLVIGGERSGKAVCDLLAKLNSNVFLYDDKMDKQKENYFLNLGVSVLDFDEVKGIMQKVYCVVLSPAISFDHQLVVLAKSLEKRVIGEMELGYMLCQAPILSVTGTNGKSTTVSLLKTILLSASRKVYLLGNIGVPLCEKVLEIQRNDVVVLEVSSYQLEHMTAFCPHISSLLNISCDHMARHKTMDNYIEIKEKIFSNQTQSEYAILNADMFSCEKISKKIKADVFYFSTKQEVRGVYVENGAVYFRDGVVKEFIINVEEISIKGVHNLSNCLCAVLNAKLFGVNNSLIAKALKDFLGLEHRIEFVEKIDGKEVFNDSKATNINSTLVAVQAFSKPICLILGGSDKGYCYDELFEKLPKNVLCCVLYGEVRYKILQSAIKFDFLNVVVCSSFSQSVSVAVEKCEENGVVLLSPASASFDLFSGFEERGKVFKDIVKEIKLHKNN